MRFSRPSTSRRGWSLLDSTCVRYHAEMDTRNLNPADPELESRAEREGCPADNLARDSLRAHLAVASASPGKASLRGWVPEAYPPGNERLSLDIDRLAYGVGRSPASASQDKTA
jgi:hypothetical protein